MTPRRRRPAFIATAVALALLGALLLGEMLARTRGLKPFSAQPVDLRVEPGGKLFRALDDGGFGHFPGEFKVTLPTGYSFRVTHGTNGLRVTHPPLAPDEKRRPELWILGCSLTHGWSLNDQDTYPWRVQAALPEFEVVVARAYGLDRDAFASVLSAFPKLSAEEREALLCKDLW